MKETNALIFGNINYMAVSDSTRGLAVGLRLVDVLDMHATGMLAEDSKPIP